MSKSENSKYDGIKINDCPFCGCKLSDFPIIMILQPEHSEEYLLAKLNKGHFLGFENGYIVRCIHCGASGGRDTIPEQAIKKWNKRYEISAGLPCKVGDMVYILIEESEKFGGSYIKEEKVVELSTAGRIWTDSCVYDSDDVGRMLFFSRDEAETALEVNQND